MNKSIVILLISIASLFLSCQKAEQNIYEINGKIELTNTSNLQVILVPSFVESDNILGTSTIKDGKFYISGPMDHDAYQALILVTDSNMNPIYPSIGTFLSIEKGNIQVEIDSLNNAQVHGTPLNNQMQACKDCISQLEEAAQNALKSTLPKERVLHDYLEIQEEKTNELMVRVATHINEEIFQEMLNEYYYLFSKNQLDTIFNNMESTTISKPFIQTIQQASLTARGEKFVNMRAQTPQGDSISLETLIPQSKYTLVDLWASWCGPCIRQFKDFEVLYHKYPRNQFNFIAFSLDTTYEEWNAAIEKHQLPWMQITDYKGWKSPIANQYGFTFIPSSVLINQEGYIIARNPSPQEIEIYIQS